MHYMVFGLICNTIYLSDILGFMNQIKFQASVLLLFLILGGGVYWAVSTLDHGVTYPQSIVVNEDEPLVIATDEVEQTVGEVVITETQPEAQPEIAPENPTPSNTNHVELVAALQKLIDDHYLFRYRLLPSLH